MRILLFLLLTLNLNAQVWPDKDLVDTPYTKGNDGIIYHTAKPIPIVFYSTGAKGWSIDPIKTNTGVLSRDSIGITNKLFTRYTRDSIYNDSVTRMDDWNKMLSGNKHRNSSTTIVNGKVHVYLDSLYCPMCFIILPKDHVLTRIAFGFLKPETTSSTGMMTSSNEYVTPLGNWAKYHYFNSIKLEEIPDSVRKYLPKGFLTDSKVRDHWNNLLIKTQYY